jgi:hypothetical protein
MRLRISQSEGRSPRSAKHLPALDPKVFADFLDVGDQVPGSVGFEGCVGRTLAAAALVEKNDPVSLRIEKVGKKLS